MIMARRERSTSVVRLNVEIARLVKELERELGSVELAKILKSVKRKSKNRFWFKKWWE